MKACGPRTGTHPRGPSLAFSIGVATRIDDGNDLPLAVDDPPGQGECFGAAFGDLHEQVDFGLFRDIALVKIVDLSTTYERHGMVGIGIVQGLDEVFHKRSLLIGKGGSLIPSMTSEAHFRTNAGEAVRLRRSAHAWMVTCALRYLDDRQRPIVRMSG